ncbi:large conductance mechanosensitive channel protein MscL [Marivivens aquimaris]|uniref:large conductance mechanosensitive channel protein MscL n=1 Tax=Marivivens aquimaris TaxID=2774876 RepID=UPI00188225AF|nr:large conductance mechanosensitive channel protein MscL [Marivivens aquimaris]
MYKEFKAFIAKGNVMDLAVGIIVGSAFTAIVNSIVKDLINPIIGVITSGLDFTNTYWVLSGDVPADASLQEARDAGAAIFAYGSFIMAVVNFFIIAFVVFLLVRFVNRVRDEMTEKEDTPIPEAPKAPTELEILMQIRDELRTDKIPAGPQG